MDEGKGIGKGKANNEEVDRCNLGQKGGGRREEEGKEDEEDEEEEG